MEQHRVNDWHSEWQAKVQVLGLVRLDTRSRLNLRRHKTQCASERQCRRCHGQVTAELEVAQPRRGVWRN